MPVYKIKRVTRARLDRMLAAGVRGTFYGGYFVVGFDRFGGGVAFRVGQD